MENQKQYCSIDIEASGFDMEKHEILEIGFVFFELRKGAFAVTEEYSQVFHPSREVSHHILALTGIAQKELDEAPTLAEHRKLLQSKLQNAALVGHSIGTDVRFLEANGFKLSGDYIDTLDLVQIMLPTYHSYNLENLMHLFGIKTGRAHRALADAKASMELLEKLLGLFSALPRKTQAQMKQISESYKLPFYNLLSAEIGEFALPKSAEAQKQGSGKKEAVKLPFFSERAIINFSSANFIDSAMLQSANDSKGETLLVFPDGQSVMRLWRQGHATAIIPSGQAFDAEKFNQLVIRTDLSADEAKFLLKILVWLSANWQSQSLSELNVSFFGSQFLPLVASRNAFVPREQKVLAADLETFLELAKSQPAMHIAADNIFIKNLADFEYAVSQGLNKKISWNYGSYLLKTFYNPEFPEVNTEFRETVTQALADVDLFFGLAHAMFGALMPGAREILINEQILYAEKYGLVKAAAENLSNKLLLANQTLASAPLTVFIEGLRSFFSEQPNFVKWVELSETRCAFHSALMDIRETVGDVLRGFKQVVFFESKHSHKILDYFTDRLGLADYQLAEAGKSADRQNGPLCAIYQRSASAAELMKKFADENLPAAAVFGSPARLRGFYEGNYLELQQWAHVFNQAVSSGTGRVFKNFSIHKNALLLTTHELLLQFLSAAYRQRRVEHVAVSRLILEGLPDAGSEHAYAKALISGFKSPEEDYFLPQMLFNLHQIINFFQTPDLREVCIFGIKKDEPRAALAVDYIKALGFNVKTE